MEEELKKLLDDSRTGLKDSSDTNKTREAILAIFESHIYKITGMYANLMQFAHHNNQTVGEKNDYYVTLEQLENALMAMQKYF